MDRTWGCEPNKIQKQQTGKKMQLIYIYRNAKEQKNDFTCCHTKKKKKVAGKPIWGKN